ncbi:hypothetical protein MK489_15405 [Myxococcota bacterium]|nr:hypothetical protein [Myxococcota bacterium]
MVPAGTRSRRAVRIAFAIVAVAALIEGSVRLLGKSGLLALPMTTHGSAFWDSDHSLFGVWHQPGMSIVHRTDCFEVEYVTNSIGARDAERTLESKSPRVIVLGDSFVEGWGIDASERLTDQLESRTGIEHINLGMSHFGPYQAYLAYREFGPVYQHDAVILAVVPVSDLSDLDYQRARKSPGYEYRYRPYLVGRYPDYREVDYREGTLNRWLRRHSGAYNAMSRSLQTARKTFAAEPPPSETTPKPTHSFFQDYSERQLDLLVGSIELLAESAGKRPVSVILVPQMRDLIRFHEERTSRLGKRLQERVADEGVVVVDLLPEFYARRDDLTRYFLPCDIHWTGVANEVAADVLLEHRPSARNGEPRR